MAKASKRLKSDFLFGAIFIVIIVIVLLVSWWGKHPVIGWSIFAVLIIALGYSIYKFPTFRNALFRQAKVAGEKIAYESTIDPREPVPYKIRQFVLQRANYRCENPDCKSNTKPHIHHINQDNSDNDIKNLIALCPNCHTNSHHGKYSFSQLRNWSRMSWEKFKRKKAKIAYD